MLALRVYDCMKFLRATKRQEEDFWKQKAAFQLKQPNDWVRKLASYLFTDI